MSDRITKSTRHAGGLKRYHTWPTIQKQNVADHTYHVIRIYVEIFEGISSDTTKYIIYHDSPEVMTGDPPFPVKSLNSQLKMSYDILDHGWYTDVLGVNPKDCLIANTIIRVKICDLLEMCEFGRIEMRLGNKYGRKIYRRTRDAVLEKMTELVPSDRDAVALYLKGIKKL